MSETFDEIRMIREQLCAETESMTNEEYTAFVQGETAEMIERMQEEAKAQGRELSLVKPSAAFKRPTTLNMESVHE